MSFGYVLLWLVGLSTASLLLRLLRPRLRLQLGWIIVASTILLVMGFTALTDLGAAGYVGAGLFTLLILIPQLLVKRAEQAVLALQWRRAQRLGFVARLFHPADGYWQFPDLVQALSGADSRRSPQVVLHEMLDAPYPIYYNLIAYALQLSGEWRVFAEWVSNHPGSRTSFRHDMVLTALYLRSLGESEQYHRMMLAYRELDPVLRKAAGTARAILHLFLFAFTGRRPSTDRALFFAIRQYPEGIKEYWRATAEAAGGQGELALERFRFLALSADPRVRLGAQRRIQNPVPPALTWMSADDLLFVQKLETEADKDSSLTQRISFLQRRPLVTQGLVALNVLYYAASMLLGGSENQDTLTYLGALIPAAVWEYHQYWRLLAAAFLHFGIVHLLMNMFALNLLGPFVENALGRVRFAVAYVLCALLSMCSVTVISYLSGRETELLVGASGAIMGLIGITAALFFRVRMTQKATIASERLKAIGTAMLLQMVFDLSTREVSFAAHASGFIVGILLGLVMRHHLTPNSRGI